MKITFVARVTVKPECESEFMACCRALEEHVQANEPDTLIYTFFRLREPGQFAVLESFRNEAAQQHHMSSPVLAEYSPKLAACVEGTWVREYLDPLESSGIQTR